MISLQVSVTSFQEKRTVTLFGHEIKLTVCFAIEKGNDEEEEEDVDYEKKDEGHDQDKNENEQEAIEGDTELI